ncbi:diphthine methyl ester synthase [Anabrus simplex]|uniref:diphthine methyl ester synthase n=1 Tax=Anabrus simplex TaxID=316456 RepID=UPI0035A39C18
MFYVIGLGLGDVKDITLKGLEIVKKADRVYLEAYTSILTVGKEALEQFYGRELLLADRYLVEQGATEILEDANKKDVAFLVVGDPFGATTHTDLVLRAKEAGIACKIIHNASIMNAIGCCGLQLYSFGETVSVPYWTEEWQPDSFYDKIVGNRSRGLHTLCLLDIKVKEPTLESLMKKKKEYLPPRFMSVSEAADQLLQILARKEEDKGTELAFTATSLCVGLARVGSDTQTIVACSLSEMKNEDLGPPLHSLIICGKLHPVEVEYLTQFAKNVDQLKELCC